MDSLTHHEKKFSITKDSSILVVNYSYSYLHVKDRLILSNYCRELEVRGDWKLGISPHFMHNYSQILNLREVQIIYDMASWSRLLVL